MERRGPSVFFCFREGLAGGGGSLKSNVTQA